MQTPWSIVVAIMFQVLAVFAAYCWGWYRASAQHFKALSDSLDIIKHFGDEHPVEWSRGILAFNDELRRLHKERRL